MPVCIIDPSKMENIEKLYGNTEEVGVYGVVAQNEEQMRSIEHQAVFVIEKVEFKREDSLEELNRGNSGIREGCAKENNESAKNKITLRATSNTSIVCGAEKLGGKSKEYVQYQFLVEELNNNMNNEIEEELVRNTQRNIESKYTGNKLLFKTFSNSYDSKNSNITKVTITNNPVGNNSVGDKDGIINNNSNWKPPKTVTWTRKPNSAGGNDRIISKHSKLKQSRTVTWTRMPHLNAMSHFHVANMHDQPS